jgi:type III pantothenate kinase
MITLAIDIGNTRTKVAVFNQNELIAEVHLHQLDDLPVFLQTQQPDYAVMCAVGAGADEIAEVILSHQIPLLRVTHQTVFPFIIQYKTPQTLGMDRVAGIAAAQYLYPHKNCLVIDAGTCITYDFLSENNQYTGGAIAPGLQMRLKAMHEFTLKLPQPDLIWPEDFEGQSTNDALLSGVCFGLADEINGKIERYTQRYGPLQVLLCGGNAAMLAKHIKNNIFAVPSLVLVGLNQILLFHVNKG